MRSRPLLVVLLMVLAGCGGGPSALALGTAAEVGHKDTTTNAATTLNLTVTAVRQGTIAELEAGGLQFDPEEAALTPFYVDATYENVGDTAVERSMRISAEDEDENLVSPVVIFDFAGEGGESGPCPDVTDGELAPGDSFSDCTLFLFDPDKPLSKVQFLSQPAEGEPEFIYWEGK